MKKSLATAWIVIALGTSVAAYAQNTALRVGAAKVDVTPAENQLPKNYEGILDHIYSRAIVIDNGSATAALISVDAGGVPDAIWQAVSKQLESDLGIPAKNVLLTATHSHSVPGQPAGPYVAENRGIGPAGQAAARARARGIWDGRFLHQRQSQHHRPQDEALVGGAQL